MQEENLKPYYWLVSHSGLIPVTHSVREGANVIEMLLL